MTLIKCLLCFVDYRVSMYRNSSRCTLSVLSVIFPSVSSSLPLADKINVSSKEINCGSPGILYNGWLDGSGTTLNSAIHFRCEDGMKFVGSSDRTVCEADGAWSAKIPQCLGMSTTYERNISAYSFFLILFVILATKFLSFGISSEVSSRSY